MPRKRGHKRKRVDDELVALLVLAIATIILCLHIFG